MFPFPLNFSLIFLTMKTLTYTLLLALFLLTTQSFAQEKGWNQWRGPDHTGKSYSTGLISSWPESGPTITWRIDTLGEGFSNFSFLGDTMFTMGQFREGNKNGTYAIALDRKDGKILWETLIGPVADPGRYVGPRSTPATDGEWVYVLGQEGDAAALDIKTGKKLWGYNLKEKFGSRIDTGWGHAVSPILDGDQLIFTIGGSGGFLVSVDKKTGEKIWQSEGLQEATSYATAVPVEIDGVPQYIVHSNFGLAGIAKDGKLLWRKDRERRTAICTDLMLVGNIVVASSAYGMGLNGYEVKKVGDTFEVTELYDDRGLESHHGGMVSVGNYVYFLTNRELVCLDTKTGQTIWRNPSVGKGSITFADGNLIVRNERTGTVALVVATPDEYKEISRFDQPERSDKQSWTYPIVVDGKMYIRDQDKLFCYSLR